VPEGLEGAACLDPLTQDVPDAARDDQHIASGFAKREIRLCIECSAESIPDHLVDAHMLVPIERQQEHGSGVHRRWVDIRIEGDRQPRVEVEAVERVQYVDVLAVRRAFGAIGLGQRHATTGDLLVVRNRHEVAWERRATGDADLEARRGAIVIGRVGGRRRGHGHSGQDRHEECDT
jgi:hypothetical protein